MLIAVVSQSKSYISKSAMDITEYLRNFSSKRVMGISRWRCDHDPIWPVSVLRGAAPTKLLELSWATINLCLKEASQSLSSILIFTIA